MDGLPDPVSAAIDGMVALWSVAPDLAYEVDGQSVPLLVVDGPPLDDIDQPRALFVGVGSMYVLTGASAGQQHGYGGRRTDRAEITCQLQTWSGDTGLSQVRAAAFEVLSTLGRLLLVSRTLGGVVDWARIVRSTYSPSQTRDGAGVLLDFVVQVEATRFEGV